MSELRLSLASGLTGLTLLLSNAVAQPVGEAKDGSAIAAPHASNASPAIGGGIDAMLKQQRAELRQLAAANTSEAEQSLSAWLDRLLSGNVAKEIQLEIIEAAAKYDSPAIKQKLNSYRLAPSKEGSTARNSELLYGGDPENGQKIFFENQKAICAKCHKIGQQGGDVGPPLNGIGTNASRQDILESILFPDPKITPGYETILVRLKDRSGHSGIVKRETETELFVFSPPDETFPIKKTDIATRRRGSSLMPDGFAQALSPRDLRDLVEFLANSR